MSVSENQSGNDFVAYLSMGRYQHDHRTMAKMYCRDIYPYFRYAGDVGEPLVVCLYGFYWAESVTICIHQLVPYDVDFGEIWDKIRENHL